METETLEQQQQQQQQQSARESSIPEDREEILETFPGHEALPSVSQHEYEKECIEFILNKKILKLITKIFRKKFLLTHV